MRLIHDSRTDADVVDGELAALDLARFGNLERRQRDELVGPLQVVVLQERLVDLLGETCFVFGIGLHRVEMFWPLGEARVQSHAAPDGLAVRIVPRAVASSEKK